MSEYSRSNAVSAALVLLGKARDAPSPDQVRNLLNTAFEYIKPFNMRLDELVEPAPQDGAVE